MRKLRHCEMVESRTVRYRCGRRMSWKREDVAKCEEETSEEAVDVRMATASSGMWRGLRAGRTSREAILSRTEVRELRRV